MELGLHFGCSVKVVFLTNPELYGFHHVLGCTLMLRPASARCGAIQPRLLECWLHGCAFMGGWVMHAATCHSSPVGTLVTPAVKGGCCLGMQRCSGWQSACCRRGEVPLQQLPQPCLPLSPGPQGGPAQLAGPLSNGLLSSPSHPMSTRRQPSGALRPCLLAHPLRCAWLQSAASSPLAILDACDCGQGVRGRACVCICLCVRV